MGCLSGFKPIHINHADRARCLRRIVGLPFKHQRSLVLDALLAQQEREAREEREYDAANGDHCAGGCSACLGGV